MAANSYGPFKKASSKPKRFKAFLWGDSGTGKTTTALSFPNPVVIDLEGSASQYIDDIPFYTLDDNDPDSIYQAVRWLRSNRHPFQTLILDPISVLWDALQEKWADIFKKRKIGAAGHFKDFYQVQIGDWRQVKGDLKKLVRLIHMLDMHVIGIAREKVQMDGDFNVTGHTYAGEKDLKYEFDTVIRMTKDSKGDHWCDVSKDRSLKRRMPDRFKISLTPDRDAVDISLFEKALGVDLDREVAVVELATEGQIDECISLLQLHGLGIDDRKVKRGFMKKYNVENFDELTKEQAEEVLDQPKMRGMVPF